MSVLVIAHFGMDLHVESAPPDTVSATSNERQDRQEDDRQNDEDPVRVSATVLLSATVTEHSRIDPADDDEALDDVASVEALARGATVDVSSERREGCRTDDEDDE